METYLQVILSIALLIILFVIGFTVFNYEYLKSLTVGGRIRERVDIFRGIHDASLGKDITFDTVNESSSLYRRLSPSYNQKSGIEMTYNFWLYVDPVELYKGKSRTSYNLASTVDEGITFDNIENQTILFVKGSKTLSNYNTICAGLQGNTMLKEKKDIYVKCPLVKLENNGQYLTVEFNTVQNPEAIMSKDNSTSRCTISDNWEKSNDHKITLKSFDKGQKAQTWNMITIILQDTYPTHGVGERNKVRCQIYVNTYLELDTYVDGRVAPDTEDYSILKPNLGHLYFTPMISTSNSNTTSTKSLTLPEKSDQLMIAHLSYFNYALVKGEIDREFNKGVGNEFANIVKDIKKFKVASKAQKQNFFKLGEEENMN